MKDGPDENYLSVLSDIFGERNNASFNGNSEFGSDEAIGYQSRDGNAMGTPADANQV